MEKLEVLLNSLIEKGWTKKAHHLQGLPNKPFVRCFKDMTHGVQFYYYEWWDNEAKLVKIYSLRDIVSIDSGLWQFVCENEMVDKQKEEILIEFYDNLRGRTNVVYDDVMYEYRLIESALRDESELEEFLLNSISLHE